METLLVRSKLPFRGAVKKCQGKASEGPSFHCSTDV